MLSRPFSARGAVLINQARKDFLKLWLPEFIKKEGIRTVLDAGCGIGIFSQYLEDLRLKVTAFDIRKENIEIAKRRCSAGIDFKVLDIEDLAVRELGVFDIVFCFGLLYHLENPFKAIRNIYSLAGRFALAETQTAPYYFAGIIPYEETCRQDQSLNYMAMIPTEKCFAKMFYKAGFLELYKAKDIIRHEEFNRSLLHKSARSVFLASRYKIVIARSIFYGIAEPGVKLAGLYNWSTLFGRLLSPRSFFEWLCEKICFCLPQRLIDVVCKVNSYKTATKPAQCLSGKMFAARAFRSFLWRLFYRRCPDKRIVIKWYYGIRLAFLAREDIFRELFVAGAFEPKEFYFLDGILKENMVFMDVGANVGLFSLFAAYKTGKKGRVIAIEPSQREVNNLKENIRLNSFGNIDIIHKAASDSARCESLFVSGPDYAGHNTLGHFSHSVSRLSNTEKVETATLDVLSDELKIDRIDVIKIDVEGHECSVLKGALVTIKKYRPVLLIELCEEALISHGANSIEVLNLLSDLGYSLYGLDAKGAAIAPLEKKSFYNENIIAVYK